jgi:hypothetical protein
MGEVTESQGFGSSPQGQGDRPTARPPPPTSRSHIISSHSKDSKALPPPPPPPQEKSHLADNGCWDISKVKEEDYDQLAVYLVPDAPTSAEEQNKAEASLPRNLLLKPSGVINDVSIVNSLE